MPEAAGNSSGKSFLQRASSKVLRWLRRSLRTSHQVIWYISCHCVLHADNTGLLYLKCILNHESETIFQRGCSSSFQGKLKVISEFVRVSCMTSRRSFIHRQIYIYKNVDIGILLVVFFLFVFILNWYDIYFISTRNGWNSSFILFSSMNRKWQNERWERVRIQVFLKKYYVVLSWCEIILASLGPRGFSGGDDSRTYYVRKKCSSEWRINIIHTSVLWPTASIRNNFTNKNSSVHFFFLYLMNYQIQSIKRKRISIF